MIPAEDTTDGGARGLRLGYVVESFGSFIGHEILELRRQGATVTLLSAFRPKAEPDPLDHRLSRESRYFPPRYRGVAAANLRALLAKPLAYLGLALQLACEGASPRVLLLAAWFARLVREEGVAHLHATFATRTATLAHAVARLAGIDWSFTTHAYDLFHPNPSMSWKAREASFVRTISEFNRRYLLEHYEGIEPAKVKVRYLGVDLARFRPRPAEPAAEPPRVLSVGYLAHKKGHAYLMGACRLLLDRGVGFTCEIVGGGPTGDFLAERLRTLRLAPHVRMAGALTHDEVWQRLSDATVFVLACIDMRPEGEDLDGIPVALMEAMAMGLPVISTTVSGIMELIEDGVSGVLVPERDESALADALARLLADPALRRRLGEAARARVAGAFDLTANTRAFATLFPSSPPARGR